MGCSPIKAAREKLGIDVTSPDIHVGRAIPLQRMRAFQDAGHVGVLIIGDYTTRIGDPSGRSAERPILDPDEIDRNAQTYIDQAMIVLDRDRTEVRFNGEWLSELDFAEILRLTRTTTVSQILERDDFSKRFAGQEPISVSELLYPLMQAYDSVAIEADVELGGTDQLYNLLAGRTVMEAYGLDPQVVLTTPLLLSWDGAKMSSSVGNNIPLTARAGGAVRPGDADPRRHARAMVGARRGAARARTSSRWRRSSSSRASSSGARTVRRRLAPRRRTSRGSCARAARRRTSSSSRSPTVTRCTCPAVIATAFGLSTSEARRMIAQGGVKLDGEPVSELDLPRSEVLGKVLQAGKRRFARLADPAA